MNIIYNEDNLKGMDKLFSLGLRVGFVIADPPYVISRKNQLHTMKDRKKPRNGIDFGKWDKEFNNLYWIRRAYKLLKKGGSLVMFNDFKKSTNLIKTAEKVGFIYKDTLIWKKTNPMPRNRDRRYVPAMEMLIWFVKPGDKWCFNRGNPNYETGFFEFPSESGSAFMRIHPTQKPVSLIKKLIEIHSNQGDIVLDPFMGSGSTAIASLETNRKYIGFEIDNEYYKSSQERLNNYMKEHHQKHVQQK